MKKFLFLTVLSAAFLVSALRVQEADAFALRNYLVPVSCTHRCSFLPVWLRSSLWWRPGVHDYITFIKDDSGSIIVNCKNAVVLVYAPGSNGNKEQDQLKVYKLYTKEEYNQRWYSSLYCKLVAALFPIGLGLCALPQDKYKLMRRVGGFGALGLAGLITGLSIYNKTFLSTLKAYWWRLGTGQGVDVDTFSLIKNGPGDRIRYFDCVVEHKGLSEALSALLVRKQCICGHMPKSAEYTIMNPRNGDNSVLVLEPKNHTLERRKDDQRVLVKLIP